MNTKGFLKKLRVAATGAAMADMALLLLVFFMASTTTEPPKGVEVKLPTAQTEGAEQDSIYISISNEGKIYYENQEVNLTDFRNGLYRRRHEKDNVVAITADKGLPYNKVKEVIDILKELDFLNVVFMAEPEKSAEQQ